jgi:hypothetical protein
MSDSLPPLPPGLEGLFAAERSAGPMPAEVRAAVWKGLEAGLVAAQAPGLAQIARRLIRNHGLSTLLGAGVGAVGGMGLQAHLDRARPAIEAPPPSTPAVVAPPAAPVEAVPPLEAPVLPVPQVPAPHSTSSSEPSRSPERHRTVAAAPTKSTDSKSGDAGSEEPVPSTAAVDRERTLIDTARAALARGDAVGALTQLSEHDRLYPHGSFNEESAGLRVLALLSSGAEGEARERAAEFRTKYPKSLMLPALEERLQRSH